MHNVFDILPLAADDSTHGLLRDVEIDHLQLLLGGDGRVGPTTAVRRPPIVVGSTSLDRKEATIIPPLVSAQPLHSYGLFVTAA